MQVLAFGDSFVKMFLHCRPTVRFIKFKGKSIKGIVKDNDEQHERVEKQIARSPKVKHVLFIFGQVDFNYVRYYKLVSDEPQIKQQVFRDYVKWVSGLNKKKNISIVSIFPSPVRQQHIINSLISKASYLPQKHSAENDERILVQYKKSKEVWQLWNSYIQKYCQIYKVKNLKLFEKYEIPEQFLDLSSLNIHLRYVPVLRRVSKFIDIKFNEKKAAQVQRQYQDDKVNRIQQSITRMAQMREQTSETTTQQQQIKNSTSKNNDSSSQSSNGQHQKQTNSQKCVSDVDDLQHLRQQKPLRKKTVEVIPSEPEEQKHEKTVQKCEKTEQASHKKQQESNSQDEDSDDDISEQFLQMAMGGKSRH